MKPSRSTSTASVLLLALPLLLACGAEPGTAGRAWAAPIRLPGDAVAELPPVTFRDVTAEAGIDFVHVTGAFGRKYLPETIGSGAAFLDYDGDGWPDLLFVSSAPWPGREVSPPPTPALYRNLGDGTFRDVTTEAGLDLTLYGMGVAAADVEGDGDVDLFLTAWGPNRLLVNEGGRFVDRTAEAGLAGAAAVAGGPPEWSTGAAFLDADGDGDLDLFVANYVGWSIGTDRFTTLDGRTKAYTTPEVYPGQRPRLYENRGDGTFRDVSERIVLADGADPKALAVLVTDVDDDGRPDLFVTNDTQPNQLLANRGDGTFRDVALRVGVAFDESGMTRAGMGVGTTVLADGRRVLAVGNFSREAIAFYRRDPSGLFVDAAPPARLAAPTLSTLTFGLCFLDYDLDGREDLALANGHIEPTIREVQKEVRYAQPPQLFRDRDGARYDDASRRVGRDFAAPIVGRGLAAADYDRDGDVDLAISANGGRARLLRNDNRTGNGWLRVRLRQDGANPDAIGARITVRGGGFLREREVRTGGSYLSQGELAATFGLGTLERADSVTVRWPDGETESFEDVPARREIRIVRGCGIEVVTR